MQKLDNNGNPIKGGLTSTRTLKNPNNLIFRDAKLYEGISDFMKDRVKSGIEYITDARGNTIVDPNTKPVFEKAVDGLVELYTTNPKQILSILADYGDDKGKYIPYAEGETPPANGRGVLIKVGANGEYVPQITDELLKVAEQIVRDEIELQSPYKKTKKSTPTRTITPGQQTKIDAAKNVYRLSTGISMGDENIINDLISQDDKISNIEVVQVGPKSKRGITIFDENGKVRDFISFVYDDERKGIISHDKTGEKLARFVSKKPDLSDQQAEYKLGGDKAGRVASGKSISKIDTPQVADFKQTYKRRTANLSASDYIAKFPEETSKVKEIFKDLGIPGVKVGAITNTSNSYEITIDNKTYTIPKAQKDSDGLIIKQANQQEVENAIQKVIDDYYGGLAMDIPEEQMQETDVMEIDVTKYNVA
jgi:hypothetical protein